MADEAFLGRRLLYLRSRIRASARSASTKKLRRKLIRVLLELNDTTGAGEEAAVLVENWPEWPAARSIAGDVQCRIRNWVEAERMFREARDLYISLDDIKGAHRLETGPLYRLAEARGDEETCLSLSSGEGPLKRVLAARAIRRSGKNHVVILDVEEDALASRLKTLEDVWRDLVPPEKLLETALEWGDGEPEWRWRLIVEGFRLWQERKLGTKAWKEPIRATACPVLDPRWGSEWREMNDDRQE